MAEIKDGNRYVIMNWGTKTVLNSDKGRGGDQVDVQGWQLLKTPESSRQIWKAKLVDQNGKDHYYTFTNQAGNNNIDNPYGKAQNGNQVQCWQVNDASKNQQWLLSKVPGELLVYKFINRTPLDSSLGFFVLDLEHGNSGNGTNVKMHEADKVADGNSNQMWILIQGSDPYHACLGIMTPPTLDIRFTNTTDAHLYASITGRDFDHNNQWFLLRADGKSAYYPADPPSVGTPLREDCAIHIGGPGCERTVTIPHLVGGRIYFAVHEPLVFLLNPGPALVEPSVTNPSDPNYHKNWGFCEFSFNHDELYANISYVDFVGLPVGIMLENFHGQMKAVLGMPHDGMERICAGLQSQSQADGHMWSKLVSNGPDGKMLRILSPNQGCVIDPTLFNNYYEPYVNEVWERFSSRDMVIDTMAAGVVRGRVQGNTLAFGAELFDKPSTRDIFSASSGPFQTGPNFTRNAIIPRLNAEFHRSTYCRSDMFPAQPQHYYRHSITNHYARLVHAANADGRGYAHPYDDAAPANGNDQSGFVNDPNPKLFSVIVGGGFAAAHR